MILVACKRPAEPANLFSRTIRDLDEPFVFCHAALMFSGQPDEPVLVCESHIETGVRYHEYSPEAPQWSLWALDFLNMAQERTVKRFCDLQVGKGYDTRGAGAVKVCALGEDPERWFCSELVAAALQRVGLLASSIPARVTPNGLSILMDRVVASGGGRAQ